MSDRTLRADTLVVVPAWNEELSVGAVVRGVVQRGYAVAVVDDGSRDDTAREAAEAGARVLSLPINLGVGAALRCGMRYAVSRGYRAIVQIDADGQHPVSAIDELLEAADRSGAHMVVGSRFAGGDPGMEVGRVRRLPMRFLARSASKACGTEISDATSGLRVIRSPLLEQFAEHFPAHYLGDTYEALVSAGRSGYLVQEMQATMSEREHGTSSAGALSAVRLIARAVIVVVSRLHIKIQPLANRETIDLRRDEAPQPAAAPPRPGSAE